MVYYIPFSTVLNSSIVKCCSSDTLYPLSPYRINLYPGTKGGTNAFSFVPLFQGITFFQALLLVCKSPTDLVGCAFTKSFTVQVTPEKSVPLPYLPSKTPPHPANRLPFTHLSNAQRPSFLSSPSRWPIPRYKTEYSIRCSNFTTLFLPFRFFCK